MSSPHSYLDEIPINIWGPLWRLRLTYEGRRDALLFALECHDDLTQLGEKISETEERVADPIDSTKGAMRPGAGPRIYKDGYLVGLKDIMQLLTAEQVESHEAFEQKAQPRLQQQALEAEAYTDAFSFALRSRANLIELQARIHAPNQIVAAPTDLNPLQAKPPLYYTSYVAALEEAVAIITAQSKQNDS